MLNFQPSKMKLVKSKRMICMKDAIPGHDPNPTEYPPVVPNEKCESEWFYMESTGKATSMLVTNVRYIVIFVTNIILSPK